MNSEEIHHLILLAQNHLLATEVHLPVEIVNRINVILEQLHRAEQENCENLSALQEILNYYDLFDSILNLHRARLNQKIKHLKAAIANCKNCNED